MSAIAHLETLDRALAARGFPLVSPWWRSTLARFYGTGRRQLVLRVGRRGGKSSSLCRAAVLEALFGEHIIPPGDVGIVGIVSVSRDEANQRLRTVRAILDALGIGYKPIDGGIELTSKPVAFKVFAASIAGVVGGTWIAAICDEVARWRDAESGANPAKEVLASLRPTMATQPNAKIFLSSSPLSTSDAHALAFAAGDDAFQTVAHAPTWEANPTVTEAETRALEPDERIRLREYKAIPQAGVLGAFDPADIARAFDNWEVPDFTAMRRVLIIDVSSGRKDSFTFGTCGWDVPPDAAPRLSFDIIDGFIGSFGERVSADEVIARIAHVAKESSIAIAYGDQRDEFFVRSAFAKHEIAFIPLAWTGATKTQAVETVRRWLREGALALTEHEPMQREMLAFEERISASGSFTFGARGNGHDDFVALLLTAAMVVDRGLMPTDPAVESGRGEPDWAASNRALIRSNEWQF